MKRLYLGDIVKAIQGHATGYNRKRLVRNAVKSQKRLGDNTLYFHFGEKKISPALFQSYKSVVVVTEEPALFQQFGNQLVVVQVSDISKAYWYFVDYYRGLMNIPVIGLTGTSGKTTTKEMIKHVLSTKYKVKSTYRSYNTISSDLRYLLGIESATQAAVFEMGLGSPGDIMTHCRHFKPQIRVLLNIGVYHLTGCKTPEGYIQAKAEILHGMDPNKDVLILNADDENIKKIDVSGCKNIVYYGFSDHARYRIVEINSTVKGTFFTFVYRKKSYQAFVPGLGKHNTYNALAAITAAKQAGIRLKESIKSLKTYKHMKRHLEIKTGPGGCTVLDDTWNNTPPAMEAAIRVLKDVAKRKKTIAILGHMYNLGDSIYAQEQYARMGKVVAETGIDLVVIVGEQAREIGQSALKHGVSTKKVLFVKNGNEVSPKIASYLNKGSIILLKAPEEGVTL